MYRPVPKQPSRQAAAALVWLETNRDRLLARMKQYPVFLDVDGRRHVMRTRADYNDTCSALANT